MIVTTNNTSVFICILQTLSLRRHLKKEELKEGILYFGYGRTVNIKMIWEKSGTRRMAIECKNKTIPFSETWFEIGDLLNYINKTMKDN